MRIPISCFIIAKNEADRIGPTIRAVKDWVDEVVVIDSGSTDDTKAVAEIEGARFVFNAWNGFGAQKRFGETLCRNHWLLNIDADEVVSDGLGQEIRALFSTGEPALSAYRIPINDVYPGCSKPRPLANDHLSVRLYDFRKVRFKDSPIHDSVDPAGLKVGRLRKEIFHHSVRSFEDQLAKAVERGQVFSDHAKRRSVTAMTFRLFFEFPMAFLKFYIMRRHILGGVAGFETSMAGAISRYIRIARMLEAAKAQERQPR